MFYDGDNQVILSNGEVRHYDSGTDLDIIFREEAELWAEEIQSQTESEEIYWKKEEEKYRDMNN